MKKLAAYLVVILDLALGSPFAFAAIDDVFSVSISGISASPGDTSVAVPINLNRTATGAADGILGAAFYLAFDEAILDAVSVERGNLMPSDWILTSNTNLSGEVTIAAFHASNTLPTASGEIARVIFNVKTTALIGSSSVLNFTKAELSDGAGEYTIGNVTNGVFNVIQGINEPPVVSDFPTYTTDIGGHFAITDLDGYVEDPDNTDDEIVWSFTGSAELSVSIVNRQATVTPLPGWIGSGEITFTAADPGGLTDSASAIFTVTPPVAEYQLDITVIGDGVVTRSADGPYAPGEVVALTAMPGAGRFIYWTGLAAPLGEEDNLEIAIIMDYNKAITANFKLYGDIDGDSDLDPEDASVTFNHWLLPYLTDPIKLKASDFDTDEDIDPEDASRIFNYWLEH